MRSKVQPDGLSSNRSSTPTMRSRLLPGPGLLLLTALDRRATASTVRFELTAHHASNRLRHAPREALGDRIHRQIAADEHHPAVALLAVLPRTLVVAVEDHVHAL